MSRSRKLEELENLGARSAGWLRAVGIADEAALRRIGAARAYAQVKRAFPRQVTSMMLYALHGALTDRHWNDIPSELKAKMREEAERILDGEPASR